MAGVEVPRIAGYERLERIGTGGYSTVYRAYQRRYDREVAVKVLRVAPLDQRAQHRFERECAMTGRLTGHPHVVTALDSGTTEGGSPFLTTDYFPGGSLADHVERLGPLDVETTLSTGVKIAGALETAHRAGVLHRDVKPQNILISAFGEPALGDFGISVLTAGGSGGSMVSNALTPAHAPPELLGGEPAQPGSDVYSLASTLYAMLAGRAPFVGGQEGGGEEGLVTLIARIVNEPPPPIDRVDVPAPVQAVLSTALAKHVADRYGTPRAFGEAMQDAQVASGLAPTPIVCPHPELAWGAGSSHDETTPDTYEPPTSDPELVEIQVPEDGGPTSDRLVVTLDEPRPTPPAAPSAPGRIVIRLDDEEVDPEITTHRTGPFPVPPNTTVPRTPF
jgi:serine/threonine-protein kinase PknK